MKKVAKKSETLSLRSGASFVYKVLYLIRTGGRMETKISLILGMSYGSLPPITSYVIFHHSIESTTGPVRYGLMVAGIAGILISLSNVSALMRELTKSQKLGWCYAILLEGTAMIMRGDRVSMVIGILALITVVGANLMKTAYNALLKTE